LPGARPAQLVPLVGRVQAGRLSEAIEHCEAHVTVETRRARDDLFALRVRGDSMIGAGILDGDLVIVRRQAKAESGDVVVARVGGEATVKRLKLARGRIELWPENPAFEPIVIANEKAEPADEFALLGKVIEVRRHLERG
jgi:repressor LexA